ncbi:MAG: DUF192 domain-containing protein [Zoogloeaceae bacterium]|jgi:uncharacterized membrane protein (UPF0127 family)|nr:DUF192 domain-containing protein [Zoogloeaceae bacterium]
MLRLLFALFAVLPVSLAFAQELPKTLLSLGLYRIEAEVADTPQTREYGLMERTHLEANAGMLFIFPEPRAYCMWMKNTLIPLSVGFFDEQGVLINVEEMQARSEATHCAKAPATFALEMNARWFSRHGITPGMKLKREQ